MGPVSSTIYNVSAVTFARVAPQRVQGIPEDPSTKGSNMVFYLPIALTALATTLYQHRPEVYRAGRAPHGVTGDRRGVAGYREQLAARHVAGLLMCHGGLVLVARP